MVVVTATAGGAKGDGMLVNIHVAADARYQAVYPTGQTQVVGDNGLTVFSRRSTTPWPTSTERRRCYRRAANCPLTSHADAAFDVWLRKCLHPDVGRLAFPGSSLLIRIRSAHSFGWLTPQPNETAGVLSKIPSAISSLTSTSAPMPSDWSAIQATEKLKPVRDGVSRRIEELRGRDCHRDGLPANARAEAAVIPTRAPTPVSSGSASAPPSFLSACGRGRFCI